MSTGYGQPRGMNSYQAFQPQGFQPRAAPQGFKAMQQFTPQTGGLTPREPPQFTLAPQMSQPSFAEMNPGFVFPTAPTQRPSMTKPLMMNTPQMSNGYGLRDMLSKARPPTPNPFRPNLPPPGTPPGGTAPPPGMPPPAPGAPPPGGQTPGFGPFQPGPPPPNTSTPPGPTRPGNLPDYTYNAQGQASQAPGTFDPRNPTGLPTYTDANGVMRFGQQTPFIPSLGQWGEYSTPRGDGFTGTRNNYNYFRGHLYGPAPGAGDAGFTNFLNQYGNAPGFGG